MVKIRKSAISGTFYPKDKNLLNNSLDLLFSQAEENEAIPKAIIAPHAGYVFSGLVAASAYKPLKKIQDKIKTIIIFGPSHHEYFEGVAFPKSDYFETPLGKVEINQKLILSLKDMSQFCYNDKTHKEEHSIEVHIPFLQKIFENNFNLVPAIVGKSTPEEISEILDKLWGNEETLIIISSDLSHYHEYEEAYTIDKETCKEVENLEFEQLHPKKMCGSLPVSGLLNLARSKDLSVKMVDFCNSGDILIDDKPINKDKVVGYASFYCNEKSKLRNLISKPHKKELLRIARHVIEHSAENEYNPPEYLESSLDFDETTKVSTFVTLEIGGDLRGCIGNLSPSRDILQDIAYNSYSAAFLDDRFDKVSVEELENINISISILTKPELVKFKSENDLLNKIEEGVDGIILTKGQNRATFLPSVWEKSSSKKEFLENLKIKAGLDKSYWNKDIVIEKYKTIKFDELNYN